MNIPRQQRSGMTMVEIMISMVVITIGLMSTFGAVGTANHTNEFTRTRNLVMSEFQKTAERIQASATISASPSTPPYITSSASSFDKTASESGSILTPWTSSSGSTPKLVTVRPKTGVSSTPIKPANVQALVITVQWRQDNNNLSSTCDYYYAPRP